MYNQSIIQEKLKSVCIINCFDTYEHRVDLLYNYFKSTGVNVIVYTSNYCHIEKCTRKDEKKDYVFLNAIPYKKNLSIKRLKSHMILSRDIFKRINDQYFNLVWILLPPNSLVKEASKYKKIHKDVKIIFDIMDLWPETMPILKFKSLPPFLYWKNLRNKNLHIADKIVTECNLYHQKMPKTINKNKLQTIYLAREVKEFNSQPNLAKDTITLCYLGSINNIIDISVIVEIIKNLKNYKKVKIHIIGGGEKTNELINSSKSIGAEVIYHGKLYDPNEKQKVFDLCHYGLNIMKESVFVGLTMKSIDYFEAGLPLINNIHGDTWDIIENEGVGFNITKEIDYEKLVEYDFNMRKKVRKYFEENFSTEIFRKNIEKIINT